MPKPVSIILADDDEDDCLLFSNALSEIPIATDLTTIYNGEKLMEVLKETDDIPLMVFLDINMPRKNGLQCLNEIKQTERLKDIPVIILSTSTALYMIKQLYAAGAQYYMRKPTDYPQLKQLIERAIHLIMSDSKQPDEIDFCMLPEN